MGFIGNLFSSNGGYNVTQGLPGYIQGSSIGGLQTANAQTQNALNQQQSFLNALGSQTNQSALTGGLNANQSNILGQQQGLTNQFQGLAGGYQGLMPQFQNVMGQYQNLASGNAPNPAEGMFQQAQAKLAQNTGQNVAQSAALMGGARGAQSNPGLITRQAGQAGAQAQQQSVGQAAELGANAATVGSQIALQQRLSGLQGQYAGLSGQMGALQGQRGALAGLSGQQQMMAGLATQGANQYQRLLGLQQGALNQFGNQNLNYQNMIQNALATQNQQQIAAQLGQGQLIGQQMGAGASMLGGLFQGLGAAGAGGAFGGAGAGAAAVAAAHGGIIEDTNQSMPHPFVQASGIMRSQGGRVDGAPQVNGDSEKNDTVPAMLSPGEVVIPRSHVTDPKKTAAFLNHLMGWKLKAA